MAVQFILGSAGSGKSHMLYTMLTNRADKNGDIEYVAIVPEQYSMESQKEIINIHPKHGAFNTEVVSFHRLALAVLEEVGNPNIKVMDDLAKTLVIRRVLESCKKELMIYSRKIGMPGFVEKIKTTISELEQYDIDSNILQSMIESAEQKPSLQYKLRDIEVIYNKFHEYIMERMITQEEELSILCKYIPQSYNIKNSEFFIDGFTGFTPIQKKVVDLLVKHARNVTFAFTLPQEEIQYSEIKEQELFALSKKTIQSVKEYCIENSVELLEDIVIKKIVVKSGGEEHAIEGSENTKCARPYRMQNSEEISHIEGNVFRYTNSKQYEKKCKDISIHTAANPRKEAGFVARQIAKMMMKGKLSDDDEELRYRDFAVITGDVETYYRCLEEAFKEYNIPAFIDYKRSITTNPFVDAIKAVIEIVETDFSYESVFHYYRLGITSEEQDLIDRFENYVLMSGKRGFRSYSMEWNKLYRGVSEDELIAINDMKCRFVEALIPLRNTLKNKKANVKKKITAIYEFVLSQKMQEKLEECAVQFYEKGELAKASEYRQTYESVIGLFDKVVDMLGEEFLSLKEFKAVLESGFDSIKVGIIPPAVDSIIVGDIERTRLKDIKKVIFLIGANDGIIPKNNLGSGVISDMEREFLGEKKFALAPTARENSFIQKLYLYLALTKPSHKLFITYSKSNAAGEEIRKSYLVSVIQKLFTKLSVIDEDNSEEEIDNIIGKGDAFRYLAIALQNYRKGICEDKFKQIYSVMYEKCEYRETVSNMVEAVFYKRDDERLDERIAGMLYGIKDNIGITRLERFAACAYSQFVQNGLKLQQRRHYELVAYDLGNLYHNSIDLFCKEVQRQKIKWAQIDDAKRKELVEYCVSEVIGNYENDVLTSSARNLYIAERVRKVTDRTVQVLGTHLAMGKFEPKYYELVVNHGRVDRVDIFEQDDRLYVKILDYKSGNKRFSLEDTFYGLQLQLMIYLSDVIEREKKEHSDKKVLPGGAYYYEIKNPYIDKPDFEMLLKDMRQKPEYADVSDDELIQIIAQNSQLGEFKMSGLTNSNIDVLNAIDTEVIKNYGSSRIIPLKYGNNGIDCRASNGVIQEEQFKLVIDYARNKTDELQNRILSGDISVNPYEGACTYCPYHGVCRFDTILGDSHTEKEKLKQDELLQQMKEAVE